jgi:lipopolysaccharide/colanic/teichoic acid biosynthesis glycosyltransferase
MGAPVIGDVIPPQDLRFYKRSISSAFKAQQFLKRVVDILLSSIGLLVLSPILATLAVLVYIDSPGPVFYRSLRMGRNNKPFYMLKFRTMIVNADAQREALRKQANLQGELFKLSHDPRITKFGDFLRRYSLDEFPQLVNVLLGEMSLVGPRPLPPDESEMFEGPYKLRFRVLPGVTGLWQVSGRSSLSFEQLCQLELSYVLNWNLLQDLTILLRTIPAVLLKRGAF